MLSSHNVVTKWHTITNWKPKITKIVLEKNGVWHTIIVALNKLISAFVPKLELGFLLAITDRYTTKSKHPHKVGNYA
jgi:hypothetical protein